MSLSDLGIVCNAAKKACAKISLQNIQPLPEAFKDAYSNYIKENKSFSRNDKIIWGCNDVSEIWSRGNGTKGFLPSIVFYVARELVSFYRELVAYRSAIVEILDAHGKNLKDTSELDCIPYIQAAQNYSEEEKDFLVRFVTDGDWWGKGREIKRAQDFFESPLMQCACLTQENQSEIARITKQFAEHEELLELLNGSLEKDFGAWYLEYKCTGANKTESNSTVRHYCTGLKAISAEQGEKDTQKWCGMYEYLFGTRPEKPVFSIGTREEFERVYGRFACVFEVNAPLDVDAEKHAECLKYTKGKRDAGFLTDHGNLSAAFSAYRKFLEWREAQNKPEDKKEELPPVDRLGVALKLFEQHRTTWKEPNRKPPDNNAYKNINTSVREFYGDSSKWNPEELKADPEKFGDFCINRTWMLSNGSGCWSKLHGYTAEERKSFVDFLDRAIVKNEQSLESVLAGGIAFSGITAKSVTELLMKFHPGKYCLCNKPTLRVLEFFNLLDPKVPDSYGYDGYIQVMGVCASLRSRLESMGITKIDGESGAADYLTVNEFIYFVSQNQDLIKEKVMGAKFKSVNDAKKPKSGNRKLADFMQDDLLKRLAAALRTKPFAILAGHSGTGKSRLVRKLAYMTCADEGLMAESDEGNAPGNYCMIQVRPNWHDSADLLGYYSEMGNVFRSTEFVRFVCKAYAYPEVPFFVCLDEMNLAPVEQYFAEYLSAIESASVKKDGSGKEVFLTDALVPKTYSAEEVMDTEAVRYTESKEWFEKYGLTIPKNLFVVGTVNMDDTTCQFSRKVLDRAMTIMMDKVDFSAMKDEAKNAAPGKEDLLELDDVKEFLVRKVSAGVLDDDQVKMLKDVDSVLGQTAFAVAYRFANEYALYEESLSALTGSPKSAALARTAMDDCLLMKVLPRIHGEDSEVRRLFEGDSTSNTKGLCDFFDETSRSNMKMKEILGRKASYLSFWP